MEKKIEEQIWKESKTFRVWSVFEKLEIDITMMVVSEMAKVSRTMAYEIINFMLKNELIEETRKVGSSRFFRKRKAGVRKR